MNAVMLWIRAALAFLLFAPSVFAQGTATFAGTVIDESGSPVAQAEVRLTFGGGRTMTATTGDTGVFSLEISGRFELEVSRTGFRTVRTTTVTLASGAAYRIDIVLLAGDPADVELVELLLENPVQFGDGAGPSVREDLPRSDRLFGLRGGLNVSGIAEGSSQQWIAASGSVFASSASASALIDPSQLSAEFSANVGIDDSLPTGGPGFNGNVYYFHRNDALNARNFFDAPDQPIPPFKYHFFGAQAGGGLREGTFAFARYWGLRVRQSITRVATVPNPDWVRGDFSSLTDPILDPETGFRFPGNIIPSDRLSPKGVDLAALFPEPNSPGSDIQNFRSVAKLNTVADAFGVRIDHRTTAADETSIEYQYSRDTTDDPFNLVTGITNLPGFGVRDALDTQTLRLNNTHVFSARLLHQIGFSFGHLRQPRTIQAAVGTPAVIITEFSNVGHATNIPQERKNRTYELSNDVSWLHGSQNTKFGGSIRYFSFDAFMDLLSRSQFQFTGKSFSNNALANLLLGLPANALRIEGDTGRKFGTWTSGVYVQHDWRVSPTLNLSAGLRWDYQTPFAESGGRVANFTASGELQSSPERLYPSDLNNWGPRLGVAWSLLPDIVVRAGYGIFYDNLAVGDSLFLLGLNPPFVRFDVENNDPVVPRFDLETVFADPSIAVPPSIFSAASTLANPYVQHWNLTLERTLSADYEARLAYTGQKGTRLRRQVNLNQPPAGPAGTLDTRRPFSDFRNVFQFETTAASSTHAMDLGLIRRFSRGLGVRADYRLARSIDDATLISILPQNSHDLASEKGLSDFHVKHRFLVSGTYNLPSPGWSRGWLNGWQLQAIGMFQSGTPVSAILGTDVAGTGSPIVNRPNLVGDPRVSDPTPVRFFDTGAFEAPEFGSFGNSGRNVIIGPGLANVDLALMRAFRVSDLLRAQFRTDFYNALNRTNFVAPPTTQNFADSPDFGALFVARSPRIIQMGLRLFW